MTRFVSNRLTPTLLVSVLCLHAFDAGAQECRKDADCPGATVCDDGRCVGADGPAPKPATTAPEPSTSAPVQAAPVAGLVKVNFVPRNANESLVVRDRHLNVSCTAPCSLNLPPGLRSIQIGSSSRGEELDVPAEGGTFSVHEPARGARTAGIVALSVGAPVALLSALLAVAAGASADNTREVTGEEDSSARSAETTCTVIAVTAGIVAVAGLVGIVTADTKAFRTEGSKTQGRVSRPRFLPAAGFDPRGSGFVGLTAAF